MPKTDVIAKIQAWLKQYDDWAIQDDTTVEAEYDLRQNAYALIDELVKDNPISGIKILKEQADFIRANFNDDTKVGVDMLATFLQDCEYVFERVMIKLKTGR